MGTWNNADGLYIKFGNDEGFSNHKAGEYMDAASGEHCTEVDIDLDALTTTSTILNDVVFIPDDAFIIRVETIALVAATSSGTPTLDVGTHGQDDRAAVDDDGFIAAGLFAGHDAAGETVVRRVGDTGAGTLVGTALAEPSYVAASYNTAAYTAGLLRVRIYWIIL